MSRDDRYDFFLEVPGPKPPPTKRRRHWVSSRGWFVLGVFALYALAILWHRF